jgi:hypothetical protein
MSFKNAEQNPKIGWLVMTLAKDLWPGTGEFTHKATSGPDFDAYNNVPMFRHNAYFGVHIVYYMDLVAHTGMKPLSMPFMVLAAVKTMISKPFSRQNSQQVLNTWTKGLLNRLDSLKFLGYVA